MARLYSPVTSKSSHHTRLQAGQGAGLYRKRVSIGGSEIAAPYDFGFQLRHYVTAPEVREDDKLVEVVRLASGGLVKVDVVSRGTVNAPRLELTLFSNQRLQPAQIKEVRQQLGWRLGLDDDLRPFYALAKADTVMSASIDLNFGAKGKSAHTMFDGVIDVICSQNTEFRRVYAMRANLAAAFGDPLVIAGGVYHASPTPEQLAAAPLAAIRACKVGYRGRYIKGVAEAVAGGMDIEALKRPPREAARAELMRLPGVGPYTADLALIIGARRRDALFLDLYIREALRQFYFGGDRVGDEQLRDFAETTWGPYQGYAGMYLVTNTEVWAEKLGIPFRLTSGALSDPDST
jgi:3-methyladenine DNA glycosylase/8-oxoguanine DNA glycosylase